MNEIQTWSALNPPPGHDPRMNTLKGVHAGQTAVLFGNGWSLALVRGWRVKQGVVAIGINRSWEIFETPYHAHIDKIAQPPKSYKGVRFGAQRPDADPELVGVFWSDYWREHGQLVRGVNPPYSGLFAIEVAVYLGCKSIYLVGFDGNARAGVRENGHFYANRPVSSGLADSHNRWIDAVLRNRRDIEIWQTNPEAVILASGIKPYTDVFENGGTNG